MKNMFKKICLVGLSALMLVGCEDMFTADNELVTTDLTPQDTLYQMMGIVERMQKLATRTVLLGEARADLVDINSRTPEAIRQLAENNVDTLNEYNNPTDYYAVINSCNIYLAYVDSLLMTHGEYYYEKEIMAAKTFRAWTYLELAKIYGEVPFITEPVETSDFAEKAVNFPKKNIGEICSYFIADLEHYAKMNENSSLLPSYAAQFRNQSYTKFFIPARVMLAELYLWRGSYSGSKNDFIDAARMYHDFLTFNGEEHPLGTNAIAWSGVEFRNTSNSYEENFKYGADDQLVIIPMDTIGFYGNTTDLRAIYNASYKNDYYAFLNPSQRVNEISRAQKFCLYRYENNKADTLYASTDSTELGSSLLIGDLRLSANYKVQSHKDLYHEQYNEDRQTITKFNDVSGGNDVRLYYVPLYRYTTLYLHMAEALNHAGFPCTAFAVLKYGLNNRIFNDISIVPEDELVGLQDIKSYGLSATAAQTDFTFWGAQVDLFVNRDLNTPSMTYDQMGIHSLGSGHSEKNAYYQLPHDADIWQEADTAYAYYLAEQKVNENWNMDNHAPLDETSEEFAEWKQTSDSLDNVLGNKYLTYVDLSAKARQASNYEQFVADKILEEEALEGMFEGLRFYDLMRYSMYYGKPDFIAETVAKRKGESENYTPATRLLGGKWYLPLRNR